MKITITKSLVGAALIGSSLLFLFSFQKHQDVQKTYEKGVKLFQKNYENYSYYIEGVGNVKIDNVTLNDVSLTTDYHYFSEGENRKGNSFHKLQPDGSYKGTWKTTADNGNYYQGNSSYKFNEDGTAFGKWDWSGMPGIYEIRIDKNE
ncbi:hypothetical protein [Aureibaculum luteum]|uniref:hypothetical protein n=1 Tax=Aureibaculum luteum TaxID=1548456 RepID=UPI000E487A98|nr:hypothetical protein [Aureibaculum luteum]